MQFTDLQRSQGVFPGEWGWEMCWTLKEQGPLGQNGTLILSGTLNYQILRVFQMTKPH